MLKFRFISNERYIFEKKFHGWPSDYLYQFRTSHKKDNLVWSVYVSFDECRWRLEYAYYYGITYVFDKPIGNLPVKGLSQDDLRNYINSY